MHAVEVVALINETIALEVLFAGGASNADVCVVVGVVSCLNRLSVKTVASASLLTSFILSLLLASLFADGEPAVCPKG